MSDRTERSVRTAGGKERSEHETENDFAVESSSVRIDCRACAPLFLLRDRAPFISCARSARVRERASVFASETVDSALVSDCEMGESLRCSVDKKS